MSQMAALTVFCRLLRMFLEPNPSIMLQKRKCYCSMRLAATSSPHLTPHSFQPLCTPHSPTFLPHVDQHNSLWWIHLALCTTATRSDFETVWFMCSNKYSLKQFSVSRSGNMRFESQKTWCPIDNTLVISTALTNIQSLFQLITLGSSYLLSILNLLDVELFCFSHSTPSH